MAGLREFTVANTYADLLTVLDRNAPNTGLDDRNAKRVFDGEGIGSPLFLSTTAVEIAGGLSVTSGVTISDGNISSNGSFSFKSNGTELLNIKSDGTIRAINVSTAPTNPQAGDLVNLNGHLYMAV